jgi:hypothetical protein
MCTLLGRIGCCAPDKNSWARSAVLKYALVVNMCGFLLLVYASLAITENYSLLQLASYSTATLTAEPMGNNGNNGEDDFVVSLEPITMNVGLRAVALGNPNSNTAEQVVRFDEFCTLGDAGWNKYMDADDCDQCHNVSMQLVIAIVVAVVAYIPTLCTDVLRMYGNFDVNCQKVWATFLSLFTLAGCVLTYYQYTYTCLDTFFDGPISFGRNGEVVDEEEVGAVVVTFDWTVGNGMICLYVGFGLKVINVICNCCIPTPTITRNRQEQEEYETLAAADDNEGSEEESEEGSCSF